MAWTIGLILAPLLLVSQAEGQCTEGDVRLEGGSRQSEGRVGVCIGERWGTVCDDFFGNDEASVVCYQLGYSRFGAIAVSRYGGGSGPILMDDVRCSGTEHRLIDCPYNALHNCVHLEDVAVQCNETVRCIEGDIRLADGGPNRGRIEVCIYEQWNSLCSETWTARNTEVVCRQLGYASTGLGTITTLPGGSDLVVYQQQFACSGTEERIIDCSSFPLGSPSSCTHDNDVTILCSSEELCSEGAVRLAGGTDMSGRVEVCVDSEWGTVCDDLWDNPDARVFCHQLGFSRVLSTRSYTRNPGTGPIHMDDVRCTGSELTLVACPHNDEHNCIHYEDAQVNCQPRDCENWEVRLVGSNGETEDSVLRGRVEICWNEIWRTVCDRGWSVSDATVVCRELGFSQFGASSFSHAYFGQGTGPVLVRDVACDGSEYALADCGHSAVGDIGSCTHANDAGASCQIRQCEDGDIRLVDGLSQYEGRLEFCFEDRWGTVCDDFWSDSATQVACRQLGFTSNHDSEVRLASDMFPVPTTTPPIPILLDNVVCSGTESKIFDCDHVQIGRHNCGHFEDVNIRCGQCTEYDVRLIDGESENEGRVEVCVSGRWGTVCDDNWDTTEAVVVCRQLQLPTQGAHTKNGNYFPPNHNLSIVMDRVTCNGEESSIGDCDYLGSNALRQCTHYEDAGVRCSLVVPCVPEELAIENITGMTLTLNWSQPNACITTDHSPITGYDISCTSHQAQRMTYQTRGRDSLSVIATGLQPFTNYTCCVNADSEAGAGQSICETVQTSQIPPSGPPLRVVGVPISHRSLSLSWLPPSSPNGIIREYRINITETDTSTSWQIISLNSPMRIRGLHPYYRYSLRVTAVTVAEGPYALPVVVQTYSDIPSAAPAQLASADLTSTSITLIWETPPQSHWNGILTKHVLQIRSHSSGVVTLVDVPMPTLTYTVVELQPCSRYEISVAAATVNGTGPIYNPQLSLETDPSAPAHPPNITHEIIDHRTVMLKWLPPSQHNCSISHYILDWRDNLSGQITSTVQTSSSKAYSVMNLHPFYNYSYRLAAFTVALGPYSSWTHIQMPEDIPSGPPQSLEATNVEQTTITISWRPPPPYEQNGVITRYQVTFDSSVTQTTALSFTASSLVPNSEYVITVAAGNSVGFGPATEIPVTTKPPDTSGPPRNMSISAIMHNQLSISWEAPPLSDLNGEIQGYSVIIRGITTNSFRNVTIENVLQWTVTELHPDHRYQIQIAVITDTGLGVYSEAISATTRPYNPSGAPVILDTEVTNRSVFLRWSALNQSEQNGVITGYVIKYRNGSVERQVQVPSSPREYTLNAVPHTEYVLAVAAVNSVGQGPFSNTTTVQTLEDVPSHEPINVMGEAISSTSIQLEWEPPPHEHHNGEIDYYTVLCLEIETGVTQSRYTTPSTEITISGLHPFYTYSCNISAVTVGPGPSSEISITTLEDVPGRIRNLYVVDVGSHHIEISWNPPIPSERNGVLRHYMISLTRLDTSSSPVIHNIPASSTIHYIRYNITGLHPYTRYNIVVAAVTIGPGTITSSAVTTKQKPPSAPPKTITLSSSSPRTLLISWSPPAEDTRNGNLSYYTIKVHEQATDVVLLLNSSSTNTQFTVNSLHPYYTYTVSVAAATIGLGPFSSSKFIRMPQAVPSSAPVNLSVDTVGPSSVLLSWLPPPPEDRNGIITHYEIYVQADPGSDSGLNFTISTNGPQTHKNIANLQSSTDYACSVAAVTVDVGPDTNKVYFTTTIQRTLGSVQQLKAVSNTSTSIRVSWQHPVEADGTTEVLNYTVTLERFGTNEESRIIITNEMSVVFELLRPNTLYECSVSARNSAGYGPTVTTVERTLPDDSVPPINIMAQYLSSRTLLLSWSPPPIEEQNGDIIGYGINITNIGNGNDGYMYEVTTGTSHVFTLHPFYFYIYSIAAINSVGRGPFSSPSSIQMPEDVPSAAPRELTASNQGPGTVFLSWQPPPPEDWNGILTDYVVTILNAASQTLKTTTTNETSITLSRLRRLQMHNFTVAATTSVGEGPIAYFVLTIPPDGRPPMPTLGQVGRISATQIKISWDPVAQTDNGGTFTSYTVKYYPLDPDASRTRKNIEDLAIFLTTNDTEMVIRDLNPVTSYSVSVAANNEAGRGNFTKEVTVGLFENCNFKLFLSGHIICQQWVLFHIDTKLEYLLAGLTMDLESTCSCDFSPKFVLFNQPQCVPTHPDWIALSGKIVSTDKSSCKEIVKLLQVWLEDESEIVVEGVHLSPLKQCPVFLEPGDPIVCGEPPSTPNYPPTTISPTTPPEPQASNSQSSNPVAIYAIVGIVVVVLILIVIIAVCIFTVKSLRKKARYSPPSAFNMQVVGTPTKGKLQDENCIEVYDIPINIIDGIYDTIPDLPPPPPCPPNRPSPSTKLCLPNPYDATPALDGLTSSEKASRSSVSDAADEYVEVENTLKQNNGETSCTNAVASIEFDKDVPQEYSQLRHAYVGGQQPPIDPALAAATTAASSHYQPLLMASETPAYASLRMTTKSDTQKEKGDMQKDDKADEDTEGPKSSDKESPLANEEKSGQYEKVDSK